MLFLPCWVGPFGPLDNCVLFGMLEFIFGVSPIANKIKNRMSFIGTKGIESYSRDSAIFGTFETNSDLSFKCRKDTTSRRVDQFSSELLGRFQKHRRSRNVTVKKFQKV